MYGCAGMWLCLGAAPYLALEILLAGLVGLCVWCAAPSINCPATCSRLLRPGLRVAAGCRACRPRGSTSQMLSWTGRSSHGRTSAWRLQGSAAASPPSTSPASPLAWHWYARAPPQIYVYSFQPCRVLITQSSLAMYPVPWLLLRRPSLVCKHQSCPLANMYSVFLVRSMLMHPNCLQALKLGQIAAVLAFKPVCRYSFPRQVPSRQDLCFFSVTSGVLSLLQPCRS